jgi:hypothetical protein
VKTGKFEAVASSAVGIDSSAKLRRIPILRSILSLAAPTRSAPMAMPIVLALTAKPMAAGVTL